jgi:predicted nucleic acid-binding protein
VTDRIVCDASAVVAMLLDAGPAGQWVTDVLTGADIFAPTLMPFECANVLRRQELGGVVSTDQAAQAHADLVDLSVELWPYEVLSDRVWGLRSNLSCYDAAYVAVAEILDAPLVTLDHRIKRAPGLRCQVITPLPGASATFESP